MQEERLTTDNVVQLLQDQVLNDMDAKERDADRYLEGFYKIIEEIREKMGISEVVPPKYEDLVESGSTPAEAIDEAIWDAIYGVDCRLHRITTFILSNMVFLGDGTIEFRDGLIPEDEEQV